MTAVIESDYVIT